MGRRCHPHPRNIFARTGEEPDLPGSGLRQDPAGNSGPARISAEDCSHHTVPVLWAAAPGEESSLGRHGGAVE